VLHQAYQAPSVPQQPQDVFPQLDLGLAIPSFLPSDDLIASLNKAMAFISITFASRYLLTNNQLRTSSNLMNHATIQDGTWINRNMGTNTAGQAKVVRCYNCQGEDHMTRQCTKPKRLRNSEWFKEKLLIVQAQESGVVLDEE
ncbi:retrovirus-related pol polyprotein from transposon TNT 1-94, partial [Tanacetum coccineum]